MLLSAAFSRQHSNLLVKSRFLQMFFKGTSVGRSSKNAKNRLFTKRIFPYVGARAVY